MEDLVKKLPQSNTVKSILTVNEDTVAAILSVIYATTVKSLEFSKFFVDKGGLQKLVDLSSAKQYSVRVAKYASQVQFLINNITI